ncbi:alpha/beta hydrolase [Pseudoruegeria sp. SHC-113]|uniref:alpha/beta hydrolase n=1 Tax=Pseudoruegeria sp. SHC-113 TaxID=2855439 RepID=UPI0021BBA155|nr:alpha/beta fold hydrolase [Pseudoruegeria sp. SHC-113]MCT8160657.1 alpha/beta hydrolase [Pseudoruegeria sp. SHC-113]
MSGEKTTTNHFPRASLGRPCHDRRRVLVGALASVLAGCTEPRHLIGISTVDTTSLTGSRKHTIGIVTTRAPSQETGELFSDGRATVQSFASVDVHVPPNHQAGRIERPRQLPPDPARHFVIDSPETFSRGPFYQEINERLAALPAKDRRLLVWVHGYNTTLTDAVLRLAQFVEDTGYTGVPILFSWASAGKLRKYVYDLNSALAARDALAALSNDIATLNTANIDVVAHSMGALLTMEAILSQSNVGVFASSGKIANIVLAAPDIDFDLFATQIRKIPTKDRGFYVLVSGDDRALSLSTFIAGGTRVGRADTEALTRLGVNAIDLSQVNDGASNHHSKFAEAPIVVQLLGTRMLAGDTFSEPPPDGLGEALVVGATGLVEVLD